MQGKRERSRPQLRWENKIKDRSEREGVEKRATG